jgi:hypothetical protein
VSYDHDDDLADAIACVEAIIADTPDAVGDLAALITNMDLVPVVISLARLLAQLVLINEEGHQLICRDCFRAWANAAGRMP